MFKIIKNVNKLFLPLITLTFWAGCDQANKNDDTSAVETLLKQAEQTSVSSEQFPQLVDSLYNFSSKKNYKKGIAKSLNLKGKYLTSKGLYAQALEKFKAAVEVSKSANELFQLGDDYYNLGSTYFDLKKREEAISTLKLSADVRGKIKDSTGLGYSYNFIGYVHWLISDYDSAVFYFEKALSIRNKLPNISNRATTYNNLGTVYYNWSLYDKALDHYLRSLMYQKETANSGGISRCLCNIGLVYTETAQNEKAIEYYRESLPYAFESKSTQTIGYAYSCMGAAFSFINKDSSIFYLKKSLETYRAGKDSVGIALGLQGIANFYLDAKDLSGAKNYFTQMMDFAISQKIPMRIARAYKGLGETYLLGNDLNQAEDYFKKSIVIGKKSSLNFILRDCYASLAEIYERQGKTALALESLKQHNFYRQLIENEGAQKRLLDLKNKSEYERYQRNLQEQRYENEKQKIYLVGSISAIVFLLAVAIVLYRMNAKRKIVNSLLHEKNNLIEGQSKEINLKNEELLELNEAKEKLFSIIAHDLRSPFHTLINLARLIKEDYETLTDDEKVEYITHLEDTAIKTYELVENLLNLSASHTGRIDFNPCEVDMKEVVEKVITLSRVQAKKKEIILLNKIEEGIQVQADQPMLEIVVRNLLNNAIKYSNKGGSVSVSAERAEDKLIISVADNGIGMDETTKANIFNINLIHSKVGTSGEKGTGLGLGLCKEFVEQHGGEIWVENSVGAGSTFVFTIPVKT